MIVDLYKRLQTEWNKKNRADLAKCGQLLEELKISLTKLSFLPTSNANVPQEELLIARNVLEIGAHWSIRKKDIPSFERYMAQLMCYYMDYRESLPESASMYELLGLNLICLLSQNRVAEFHTELELLPPQQILKNIYIKHPVSMEQYLMEGSYNKIFLSKENVPSEGFKFFIDILLNTIRDEIAGCIEKAYERLLVNEAVRMLFIQSPAAMQEYANKRQWKRSDDDFYYFTIEVKRVDEAIPSFELASQAIEYARELEMIV